MCRTVRFCAPYTRLHFAHIKFRVKKQFPLQWHSIPRRRKIDFDDFSRFAFQSRLTFFPINILILNRQRIFQSTSAFVSWYFSESIFKFDSFWNFCRRDGGKKDIFKTSTHITQNSQLFFFNNFFFMTKMHMYNNFGARFFYLLFSVFFFSTMLLTFVHNIFLFYFKNCKHVLNILCYAIISTYNRKRKRKIKERYRTWVFSLDKYK